MPTISSDFCEALGPLETRDFEEIRRLAYRTFGLDLRSGKEELVKSRLRRLVLGGGFRSFRDYCKGVLNDGSGSALTELIDALTTNHTSFLRERGHFDFLTAHALELARPRGCLDIWSAGCSTGEEVWSLLCTLEDAMLRTPVHVWGTDISNKALRVARQAVYSAERCRTVPPPWLSRYFEPAAEQKDHYQVGQALRSRVTFQRLNLVGQFSWPQQFAAIFCRNVMIYFDQATQQKVVRELERALAPGGYLFIGHAESLIRISHSLEYVRPAVYSKPRAKAGPWNRS